MGGDGSEGRERDGMEEIMEGKGWRERVEKRRIRREV